MMFHRTRIKDDRQPIVIDGNPITYTKKLNSSDHILYINYLHSSMVVCIHPIVLYCVHPRGKTVVFFSNKVNEKKHMPKIHIKVLLCISITHND